MSQRDLSFFDHPRQPRHNPSRARHCFIERILEMCLAQLPPELLLKIFGLVAKEGLPPNPEERHVTYPYGGSALAQTSRQLRFEMIHFLARGEDLRFSVNQTSYHRYGIGTVLKYKFDHIHAFVNALTPEDRAHLESKGMRVRLPSLTEDDDPFMHILMQEFPDVNIFRVDLIGQISIVGFRAGHEPTQGHETVRVHSKVPFVCTKMHPTKLLGQLPGNRLIERFASDCGPENYKKTSELMTVCPAPPNPATRRRAGGRAQQNSWIVPQNSSASQRGSTMNVISSLMGQRGSLEAQRNALTAQRNSLTAQRDSVIAQRDSVIAQRDSLAGERSSLLATLGSAIAERNHLSAANQWLQAQLASSTLAHPGTHASYWQGSGYNMEPMGSYYTGGWVDWNAQGNFSQDSQWPPF